MSFASNPLIQQGTTTDHNGLTAIQADYLEIIYEELLVNGSARGCAIAKAANVTRSTVTSTMRALKEMGFIHYEPYGTITLTENGLSTAKDLRRRRQAIEAFFTDIFGTPPQIARELADMNKHGAPDKMVSSLQRLTRFIRAHKDEWLDWERQEASEKPHA